MSLLTFLLLLVLQVFQVQAHSRARDTVDKSAAIEKLEFSQDPHTIGATSSFQVEFDVPYERQRITLNLQPSRHVLTQNTNIEHVKPNKKYGQTLDLKGRSPLLYKGVAWVNDDENQTRRRVGWARMMVRYREGRHIIEGTFTNDGAYHHISLDSNYQQTRRLDNSNSKEAKRKMTVWKELVGPEHDAILKRSATEKPSCGAHEFNPEQFAFEEAENYEGMKKKRDESHPPLGITRRQNPSDWFDPANHVGDTDGCPSSRRVALVGIAADCSYTAEFDDMQDARDNIISMVNVASQVYEDTFNIALAIQNLTMSDPSCPADAPSSMPWNLPCTANVDINTRLNLFTRWRNRMRDNNAVWSLLTACRSGSTVGIAWIGSLCNRSGRSIYGGGGTASANVVVRTSNEWQVFAHELAHNFGAAHDCTSSECSDGYSRDDDCCPLSRSTCDARNQYIMNPQSSPGIEEFSPCTIGTICTGIGDEHIDTSCLVSEDDVPDINDSQCGNGIVEPGETCDCGGSRRCPSDSCCNPETCQLRNGAECDPVSDGCCTEECRVADSGLVCRESTADCDPEERCDGSSGQCPIDVQNCTNDDDVGGDGRNWFDRNRTAVIATAASVGGFIVLLTLCCLLSCLRRKSKARKQKEAKLRSMSDGSNPPSFDEARETTQMPTAPRMTHRYT
ncbi:hypothetical protein NW768_002399 [Fusarium equiseti]|uniref:Disintegrin and metalloproteinase domain-containing protein B n=1 Tax=Fusarium equiseti TaxID=61235 RepID=A0ABQ8RNL8_FUSEQ|nr:hypothetical protein NW768_002399 [Fusarium equiseti]